VTRGRILFFLLLVLLDDDDTASCRQLVCQMRKSSSVVLERDGVLPSEDMVVEEEEVCCCCWWSMVLLLLANAILSCYFWVEMQWFCEKIVRRYGKRKVVRRNYHSHQKLAFRLLRPPFRLSAEGRGALAPASLLSFLLSSHQHNNSPKNHR